MRFADSGEIEFMFRIMRLHEVVRNFMSEREEPDNAMRNGVIWYNEIIPTMRYKRWKDCLSARQRHL